MEVNATFESRFWSKVSKRDDGCWLWTGALAPNGYGTIIAAGRGSKRLYAHRVSWEFANGRPPADFILHHCDVRNCVNPEHLYEGTQLENIHDAWRRGRMNPYRKVTEEQAKEIIERLRNGESQGKLAKEYPISQAAISLIARGKNWKHLQR